MVVLVDSNLLLRTAKPDDPARDLSAAAVLKLKKLNHQLVIVPQCLYEFYAVATRPKEVNGLGHEPSRTLF